MCYGLRLLQFQKCISVLILFVFKLQSHYKLKIPFGIKKQISNECTFKMKINNIYKDDQRKKQKEFTCFALSGDVCRYLSCIQESLTRWIHVGRQLKPWKSRMMSFIILRASVISPSSMPNAFFRCGCMKARNVLINFILII